MQPRRRHRPPEHPRRPALPPILLCALGLWAASALAYAFGQKEDIVLCAAAGITTSAGALGTLAFLWRKRSSFLWCVVVGMLVGITCGFAGAANMHFLQQQATSQPAGRMVFEVIEDAREGMFAAQGVAQTTLSSGHKITVKLNYSENGWLPRFGDMFEADVSLFVPQGQNASYSWQNGITATATVRHHQDIQRSSVMSGLLGVRNTTLEAMDALGGEGAAVLQALVCGSRTALGETSVYDAFKVTGLAHIIAVSGAHLVIVCALVGSLMQAVRAPRALAIGVQILLVLCYLVFSAAPISAVRAAVMVFVGVSAFFARRRPASLNALGICIMAMIALNPSTALSVSFALSALSTLGIVLFVSLISSWILTCVAPMPRFISEALALTFASSVIVQPLSVALFSQLSLVSPLANVLVAPFLPLICGLGLVASLILLVHPVVGQALLQLAATGTEWLCVVVRFCASLPYASIPVSLSFGFACALSVLLSAVLWVWWPRIKMSGAFLLASVMAGCFTLAVFVAPRFSGDEIVMLDVGQGDAFLVKSAGANVLIDTGNQDRLLREALARQGIFRLDAVIITHGDDDHCGSLVSLAQTVEVNRVLVAEGALECECDACKLLCRDAQEAVGVGGVQGLRVGNTLRVGVFTLSVVWPEEFSEEGGNADSVCLLARADVDGNKTTDWTALFTGDVEHDQLISLLESSQLERVDLLKVGHHGSKNALTPKVASHLSPRIALVSAGINNRYGHPSDNTLEILENVGAQVLRTDTQGDVSCKLTSEGITVRTLR